MKIASSLLATAMLAGTMVTPAAAIVVITSVEVKNINGIAGEGYLQIAELQLFGGPNNYALTGIASATSTLDRAVAAHVNDGSLDGTYPSIYHGTDPNGLDVFTLSLGTAQIIDRMSIYGRTDCCSARDIYSYTLFNGSKIVGSGTLDARGAAFATVDLGSVPEPATWSMMLLGLGSVGYALRRRKKVKTQIHVA